MLIKLGVALYVICAYVIAKEASKTTRTPVPPTKAPPPPTKAPPPCSYVGTVCDCSKLNLSEVPDDLLNNITSLDLSKNNLTVLEAGVFKIYTNLSKIILDENRINNVTTDAFKDCKVLKEVSMAQNQLTQFDKDTFKDTVLETLTLSQNKFQNIPELSNVAHLTNLDITALGGENVLDTVTFSDSFKSITITTLVMSRIGIRSIPAALFSNVNASLTSLDLSGNRIETIEDDAFKSLSKLTTLLLADNNIRSVGAKTLNGLSQLTTFDVGGNEISSISDDAFNACTLLEAVTMTSTIIQDIGKTFANLKKLKTLDLSNNPSLQLNGNDSFINASVLSRLIMSGLATGVSGNFYELPIAIRKIRNLTSLDVSQSKFTTFNEKDLAFFDKLKILRAVGNPYSCTCANSKFITWTQSTKVIPKEDVAKYTCTTCDKCTQLPQPMKNYDLNHCNPAPKPTSTPEKHDDSVKYGVGFTFLGLVVGILLTSLIVVYMVKTRRACFRSTPYADLDATA